MSKSDNSWMGGLQILIFWIWKKLNRRTLNLKKGYLWWMWPNKIFIIIIERRYSNEKFKVLFYKILIWVFERQYMNRWTSNLKNMKSSIECNNKIFAGKTLNHKREYFKGVI